MVVDPELNLGPCELGQLHGLLEQSDSSLLESDSPDPVIEYVLDVYLFATHLNLNQIFNKVF